MKKSLLIAAAAVVSGSAFAAEPIDPATYDVVNGMCLKNRFLIAESNITGDLGGDRTALHDAYPMLSFKTARTACIAKYNGKDVAILANSEDAGKKAKLYVIDIATGAIVKTVVPTIKGEALSGTLCANQIGCDDYGHIWLKGAQFTTYKAATDDAEGAAVPFVFYQVDLETGALTEVATVAVTDYDEANATDPTGGVTRIDYFDLVGDITLTEDRCAIACIPSNTGGGGLALVAWEGEKGGEFKPMFKDGEEAIIKGAQGEIETHPANQSTWGTAPVTKIVKGDATDFSASMFYLDGMTTTPALYDRNLAYIDGFKNAASSLWPSVSPNGIIDIALNGNNYTAYVVRQYNEKKAETRICSLNEAMEFSSLEKMWDFPTGALGGTSDGGNRIHCLSAKIYKDANDVEGAYILNFKCYNGIGVYTFAPEGWVDPNGEVDGVNDIVADDTNAPVEYYNLNGVKVSGDLTPGLYITRQGNKVAKQIVK